MRSWSFKHLRLVLSAMFLMAFLAGCAATSRERLSDAANAKHAGAVIGEVISESEAEVINLPAPDPPKNCGLSFFAHAEKDDSPDVKIAKYDLALTRSNANSKACENWWQSTYRQIILAIQQK